MTVVAGVLALAATRTHRLIPPAAGAAAFAASGAIWLGLLAFDVAVGFQIARAVAQRRSRMRARKALPEFVEAAGASLGVGLPLADALRGASLLAPGLGAELGHVVGRLEAGAPYQLATEPLRSHADPDVRFVGATIELAAERMSDAEPTFLGAAVAMRERRLRRSEISAQASQATASALLMALVPLAGVAFGFFGRAGIFDPHLDATLAATVLSAGVALSLVGTAWSLRLITQVEASV
ncbi:MAG: type II secretion system F family protein [Acidimicrobiales bacterium]|nr:type II secretion system F family protein [Acidimicrobiales bacterium]